MCGGEAFVDMVLIHKFMHLLHRALKLINNS